MLNNEDIRNLTTVKGPCLTILEPIRDPVLQVTKADTRLTAAVQQADRLLVDAGMTEGDRETFLAPIRKLATNTDWTGRSGSIAVFRAPGFTQAAFLPGTVTERVHYGEQFLILPVLNAIAEERSYWLLALSINKIHLFRGKGNSFTEYALPPGLPRSLADFMGLDKPDHDLEGRSAKGPSSGTGGGIRFGTTNQPESEAAHLHDYFLLINRTINPTLVREGSDPLVLAAVPRELALYRAVATYLPLVQQAIHGSPDALGFDRLHKSALQCVAAHATQVADLHVRDLDTAASRKVLETDIAVILSAALAGSVSRLFINRQFANNPATLENGENAMNEAALAVLRNSGSVVYSDAAAVHGVAAVLRYGTAAESVQELDLVSH